MSDSEDAAPDIPENITPGDAERGREVIEQFLDEHPGPSYRDEDILRQMHHDEDLSPPQIADRLDVDPVTIRNWLHQYDIHRGPEDTIRSSRPTIPTTELASARNCSSVYQF